MNMRNKERWKAIPSYEGLYQVSSIGRIRSLSRVTPHNHLLQGKFLKISPSDEHYKTVSLTKNNITKTYAVHVLMCLAFLGPKPSASSEVRHLDGVKINNDLNNLRWGTKIENGRDSTLHGTRCGEASGCTKLTEELVKLIKKDLNSKKLSQTKLADKYKTSRSTIRNINCGYSWGHITI